MVAGIAGISSDWWLVTAWIPFHFFTWGIRETIRAAGAQNTAMSSASDSTVEPVDSENPSDPEEESDAPTSAPASTEADIDTDKQ